MPIFWHLWRCASVLSRGKEEMALGKRKEEVTYNAGWVQFQPKSTTGNFTEHYIGIWALVSKWECKLFKKMNSSHANTLKEEEWRIPPWRTLPTWPGNLPGLESCPLTRKDFIRNPWRRQMQTLPHSRYNNLYLWENVNSSVVFSSRKSNRILFWCWVNCTYLTSIFLKN